MGMRGDKGEPGLTPPPGQKGEPGLPGKLYVSDLLVIYVFSYHFLSYNTH